MSAKSLLALGPSAEQGADSLSSLVCNTSYAPTGCSVRQHRGKSELFPALEEARGVGDQYRDKSELFPAVTGWGGGGWGGRGGYKKLSSNSIQWIQSAAEHRGGSSEPSRMTARRRWHGAVTQRAVRTLKSRWGEGGGRVGCGHCWKVKHFHSRLNKQHEKNRESGVPRSIGSISLVPLGSVGFWRGG